MAKKVNTKTSLSDEERLQLAAKLDEELDEFIDSLEKRQYTEGWPEDKWEEEMEKHPFFMKKPPEPGDELHPLLEGIQQLKYDPEENTGEELANIYKEDGNFNFKYKKYRMAIWSYTEGIKQNHNNIELKATLYNNRAASHYFLKNYRSSLRDCENALKLKPNYEKVLIRAAHCYYETEKFQQCIDYCTKVLDVTPDAKEVLELRQKAILAEKARERDARKRQRDDRRKKNISDNLLNEINKRGICLEDGVTNIEQLEPRFPEISNFPVRFDDINNQLIWPLAIMYPEFKTMDFIQQVPENDSILDHLAAVLVDKLVWDDSDKYKLDNVNIYYEERLVQKLHGVDVNMTLGQLLSQPGYVVSGGTPTIIILAKGSDAEKHFCASYR